MGRKRRVSKAHSDRKTGVRTRAGGSGGSVQGTKSGLGKGRPGLPYTCRSAAGYFCEGEFLRQRLDVVQDCRLVELERFDQVKGVICASYRIVSPLDAEPEGWLT